MCGISGFLSAQYGTDDNLEKLAKRMANAIEHRGPDDSGAWSDVNAGIALSHRRLSIVDLSDAGHQPMMSPSGRYVIVFNGEIYNHLALRSVLQQNKNDWRGHSDTETLLMGFDQWGISKTISQAIGMFAFAVWDKTKNTLTLCRDRLGEKPLYFGWQGNDFLFGSELKALRAHPSFKSEIDRDSLCLLLRHSHIPAPYSIYKGIAKLNPGCSVTVSLKEPKLDMIVYWSGSQIAMDGAASVSSMSPNDAIDELEKLLRDSISQQMMGDVPVGAFLSGGVDSSTVVALMQAQSSQPVKTFSLGFSESSYNEAEHAKLVAQHLGTDHTELYITPAQAMEVIVRLPMLYDEPFSDSSQIATFLVSQLAKEDVMVSLSGDGGDELFCGYNRYQFIANIGQKLNAIPLVFRRLMARIIKCLSPRAWDNLARVLPGGSRFINVGEKLHKGAGVLASSSIDALYYGLLSHWTDPASVVLRGTEPPTLLTDNTLELQGLDDVQRMMALDMLTYLPNDILTKVDRAAMGVSLETRVPFLDHRLVEFAWRLPQAYKLREGQTKWILRQVLYKYVPKELIERPKMGFTLPLDSWLRGPLREWAERLLDESRLRNEGYFNPVPIQQKWKEHLSGKRNWQHHLWNVLMFQAWLEVNKA